MALDQIECGVCGRVLGHINEACPNCLPGFYRDAFTARSPYVDMTTAMRKARNEVIEECAAVVERQSQVANRRSYGDIKAAILALRT